MLIKVLEESKRQANMLFSLVKMFDRIFDNGQF